ncbi:hypothetical protein GR927_28425 [Mycolicibacterium sp. 3033]|nr:hypothetical protein [Mycolicibacterium aurantiacum]
MTVKHMIGPIQVEFRERGHRVLMSTSGDKDTVKRVADETELLEDVEVPRSIELTTSGGADPDMYVRVELRDGSPVLAELSWKSGPHQGEIRQKHLRQTDVAKLVTDLVVSTISRERGMSTAALSERLLADDVDVETVMELKRLKRQSQDAARRFVERQRLPRERRVMTDEFLLKVAEVYRENIDGAPTKVVGETFGVQPRMASKYVDRARQKGFLPPTVRGQKKA